MRSPKPNVGPYIYAEHKGTTGEMRTDVIRKQRRRHRRNQTQHDPLDQRVDPPNQETKFGGSTLWSRGSDDLAYVDWSPVRSSESASVSITDLHARLNHLPFNSLWQLIRGKSVDGIPDHVLVSDSDVFCEDCVNGKLTRAPHTKPATRAPRPLFRVFSDVHGPLTV